MAAGESRLDDEAATAASAGVTEVGFVVENLRRLLAAAVSAQRAGGMTPAGAEPPWPRTTVVR